MSPHIQVYLDGRVIAEAVRAENARYEQRNGVREGTLYTARVRTGGDVINRSWRVPLGRGRYVLIGLGRKAKA